MDYFFPRGKKFDELRILILVVDSSEQPCVWELYNKRFLKLFHFAHSSFRRRFMRFLQY